MTRRTRVAAIAAAALVALALVPPGVSGDRGANTHITMSKLSSTGAAGEVNSGRRACEGGRKVSLFVLESFFTDKLAVTRTNSRGRWRIERVLKEGVYFAKVESAEGCRFDNSRRKRLTIG